MKKGDYVRITKIGSTIGGIPACPMPLYAPGEWVGVLSLPMGYWMEGVLVEDVRKGAQIHLDRHVRHGVTARGAFSSTRVISIKGDQASTYNSVWKFMRVPPTEPMNDKDAQGQPDTGGTSNREGQC